MRITDKNKSWIELCEYVKLEILRYPSEMKFPTSLALKLQGLKKGKHIANNLSEDNANYDDNTILCAFKICKPKILKYLHDNETSIKDENHKVNLIMKIVEQEINDVYIRLQQARKKEEKIERKTFDNQYNGGAEYIPKSKETSNNLKNLW